MSVIAEFTVPTDEFAFGAALSTVDEMTIILEEIVPTGDATMPYFWAEGADFEAFECEVRADPSIEELVRLDRVDDAGLYRAQWHHSNDDLLTCIVATQGVMLEARSQGRRWYFRLRFPTHDDLTSFYDRCNESGIVLAVDSVYDLAESPQLGRPYDLTPEQREALVLAVERGYFSVPGETTLDDLASELGISQQALSKRIRRGNEKILRTALLRSGENGDST